jgi:CRISPR-associated endonuclease/helicase Cas3
MDVTDALFRYWGKSDSNEAGQPVWHSLVYHCLDVAAVTDRLLARHRRLRETMVRLAGLPEPHLSAWIRFFVAIHDLGKFSSAFQQLVPEIAPPRARSYFYSVRHDTLAHIYWRRKLYERVTHRLLGAWADGEGRNYAEDLLDQWMLAVSGHHGQPPKTTADDTHTLHFSAEDEQALNAYVDAVSGLFLGEVPASFRPGKEFLRGTKLFSWWLAGLTVVADWLGSNREFFEFRREPMPLETYWSNIALPAANRALDHAGLLPNSPNGAQPITQLFSAIETPTPLQAACAKVAITHGPQLFLVEDVTGAGKTEAAFVLVNRLLAAGAAVGAYLALPTMATANAMYRRTAEVYRRLFVDGEHPTSLVLAHGSRHLDDRFTDSVLPRTTQQGEYEPGEPEAGAHCNAWLADGSKRALLAQMGVGTLDQALLAVLTSRHQSLRLLGLLDKVLLVDEVHASDAYMHRLLCEVLALHARAGGSAILLSATLPKKMRNELVQAFCEGVGRRVPGLDKEDYPLLTRLGADDEAQIPVPTRTCVARTLGFEIIHDEAAAEAWIVDRAEAGACVAWVRNTVGDAISAYQRLSARLGQGKVMLFHARFAMGDRLRLEEEIVDAFGKSSRVDARTGRVVIATQVIEQSLDLDLDEMVSDLASIDLMLQRAGRLRRHTRDARGNPLAGDDERGPVLLRVLAPDPDAEVDSRWFARLLPGAAVVYPDHGQLWATARLLKVRGQIAVPGELRSSIESVFGDLAPTTPEPLRPRSNRAEGTRSADASLARFNAIKPGQGYRHEGADWWDESYTPTRLGDVTTTIRLARWDGVHLRPWSDDPRHPWAMSEVRARGKLKAPTVEPGALADAIKAQLEEWGKGFGGVLLALTEIDGRWCGIFQDGEGKGITAIYSAVAGLTLEKGGAASG